MAKHTENKEDVDRHLFESQVISVGRGIVENSLHFKYHVLLKKEKKKKKIWCMSDRANIMSFGNILDRINPQVASALLF